MIVELLKYIFIGVVQGFTEILPISSSGHVEILRIVFNIEADTGYFMSSLLNLGSFVAISVFFWKFEKELIVDFIKYVFKNDRSKKVIDNFKYCVALIIATIPVAILGIMINDAINSIAGSVLIITGVGFFASATLLFFTKDIVNKYVNTKITRKDGLIIGLIQPIALIPGLSRLSLVTCSGLLRKKSMETSLSFSILLYLPISFGQLVLGIRQLIINPNEFLNFDSATLQQYFIYLCGFVASIVVTYFALNRIFIWVRKGRFGFFAIYNAAIGLLAFIYGIYMY